MLEKEFIQHNEALALKELGFDEGCIAVFRGMDIEPVCQMGYDFKTVTNTEYSDETDYWLTRPTFSQTFRFFKEKYDLYLSTPYCGKGLWNITIFDYKGRVILNIEEPYTDEKIEVECLKRLIEIVKQREL